MNRNIALCIVLTIITCGIYGIYWMIVLNDDINSLSGVQGTSGGMVFLFSLVTCGIYGLYWVYKMGERIDMMYGARGNTGILYLLISIFGFSIVAYALMQSEINQRMPSN